MHVEVPSHARVLHESLVQVIAVPAQAPAVQTSVCVQALPSSQARPDSAAQVPFAPAPAAALHAWQSPATLPPQAVSQQTPSTQKVLAQLAPVVPAVPFGSPTEDEPGVPASQSSRLAPD